MYTFNEQYLYRFVVIIKINLHSTIIITYDILQTSFKKIHILLNNKIKILIFAKN